MTMQWCHVQTPEAPLVIFYKDPDRAKDLLEELQRKGNSTKEGFKIIELTTSDKKKERKEAKVEEVQSCAADVANEANKGENKYEHFYNNYGVDWHRQFLYVAIE